MIQLFSALLPKITYLLVLLFFISEKSHADDYLSPNTIEGITKIDAELLIKLAREHDDLVIIDSRIRSDRRQGYITGSISLPDTKTDCSSLFRIINRKYTPTVFYCNGGLGPLRELQDVRRRGPGRLLLHRGCALHHVLR